MSRIRYFNLSLGVTLGALSAAGCSSDTDPMSGGNGEPTTQPPTCAGADRCMIAPGIIIGNTTGDGDDCSVFSDGDDGGDHILRVTLPDAGDWTFSLCGSTFDTLMQLGTSPCGSELGFDDDSCGTSAGSEFTANLAAGVYFLTIDGFDGDTGRYRLEIFQSPTDFAVLAPGTFSDNTNGAGDDCDVPDFPDGADHVYEVTVPNDGLWTFSLCGSSFDTALQVGTSICGGEIGFNDDSCGFQSRVVAELTAGVYYVTVDGFEGWSVPAAGRVWRRNAPEPR